MTRATNEQRIIEALRRQPGLDDDELSRASEVTPRQQVNQICRLLESRGQLRREYGPRGKIINILADPKTRYGAGDPPGHAITRDASQVSRISRAKAKDDQVDPVGFNCDPAATLFVFPCSGSKEKHLEPQLAGPSILDDLPPALARRFADAREKVRVRAHVDETSLIPAWQRYTGSLYQSSRDALSRALGYGGVHMIIVSGGYGLVLAAEPVGYYEAEFKRSWWPDCVLEDVILQYLDRHGLRSVRAVASATTEYAKFLRQVDWCSVRVDDAWLLTPERTTGAMVKSPRTQGEALAMLLSGGIHRDWVSSDELCIIGERLA